MLKVLLPTTLPRAMSARPPRTEPRAEPTLTAVSGGLVPNATTVGPITNSKMPSVPASREAPCTRSSALAMSRIAPKTNKINVKPFSS